MPGKFLDPFALRQIAADARCQGGALDQAGDLLVIEPVGADVLALPGHPAKQGAMANAAKFEPGLQSNDRTGGIG